MQFFWEFIVNFFFKYWFLGELRQLSGFQGSYTRQYQHLISVAKITRQQNCNFFRQQLLTWLPGRVRTTPTGP